MALVNKIFAFGDDYPVAGGAYARAKIARDNIARVQVEKIAEGCLRGEEAVEIARTMLSGDSSKCFKIDAD